MQVFALVVLASNYSKHHGNCHQAQACYHKYPAFNCGWAGEAHKRVCFRHIKLGE